MGLTTSRSSSSIPQKSKPYTEKETQISRVSGQGKVYELSLPKCALATNMHRQIQQQSALDLTNTNELIQLFEDADEGSYGRWRHSKSRDSTTTNQIAPQKIVSSYEDAINKDPPPNIGTAKSDEAHKPSDFQQLQVEKLETTITTPKTDTIFDHKHNKDPEPHNSTISAASIRKSVGQLIRKNTLNTLNTHSSMMVVPVVPHHHRKITETQTTTVQSVKTVQEFKSQQFILNRRRISSVSTARRPRSPEIHRLGSATSAKKKIRHGSAMDRSGSMPAIANLENSLNPSATTTTVQQIEEHSTDIIKDAGEDFNIKSGSLTQQESKPDLKMLSANSKTSSSASVKTVGLGKNWSVVSESTDASKPGSGSERGRHHHKKGPRKQRSHSWAPMEQRHLLSQQPETPPKRCQSHVDFTTKTCRHRHQKKRLPPQWKKYWKELF